MNVEKIKYTLNVDDVGYLDEWLIVKIKRKVEKYLSEVDPLVLKMTKKICVQIRRPKVTRKGPFDGAYFRYPVELSFGSVTRILFVSDYGVAAGDDPFWDVKIFEYSNGLRLKAAGAL